jgi:hypothetical protein
MSAFFGGHADASGQVVPEATGWAFGQDFASATADNVRHCENLDLEEVDESELDFQKSHKRVLRRDGTGYYRYYRGDPKDAEDAASAYCVSGGFLILLARPGQGGRLQSERIGSLPVGRALRPDDRVLPSEVGR